MNKIRIRQSIVGSQKVCDIILSITRKRSPSEHSVIRIKRNNFLNSKDK